MGDEKCKEKNGNIISRNKPITITIGALVSLLLIAGLLGGIYWKSQLAIASSEASLYKEITKETERKYATKELVAEKFQAIKNEVKAFKIAQNQRLDDIITLLRERPQ